MRPSSLGADFDRARAPLVAALAEAARQSMAEEIERSFFTMMALSDYPSQPAFKPSLLKRISWKVQNLRRGLALRIDPTLLEEGDE